MRWPIFMAALTLLAPMMLFASEDLFFIDHLSGNPGFTICSGGSTNLSTARTQTTIGAMSSHYHHI